MTLFEITVYKQAASTCRTNTVQTRNENTAVVIHSGVFVRSEADSNRCTRFCRPLPSHSAIRPFFCFRSGLRQTAFFGWLSGPFRVRLRRFESFRFTLRRIGVQIYKHF